MEYEEEISILRRHELRNDIWSSAPTINWMKIQYQCCPHHCLAPRPPYFIDIGGEDIGELRRRQRFSASYDDDGNGKLRRRRWRRQATLIALSYGDDDSELERATKTMAASGDNDDDDGELRR